jgi:putative Mn2+ efflux pump MntP
MKNKSKLFTFIMTLLGSSFMLINLKKNYCDEVWNYFFVLLIFMLNGNEFIKFLKEKKNENEKNR